MKYLKYLWHKYVIKDLWAITTNFNGKIGEILTFATGQMYAEVVWKEREGTYYKLWLRIKKGYEI